MTPPPPSAAPRRVRSGVKNANGTARGGGPRGHGGDGHTAAGRKTCHKRAGGRRRGGRKNGSGSTRQVRGRGGAGRQRLPPARIDGGGQPTATPSERRTSRRRIAGAGWRRERQPGGEGVTRSSGSRWARTPTDQAMVRWRGCAHGGVRAQVWQYRSGRLSRGGLKGRVRGTRARRCCLLLFCTPGPAQPLMAATVRPRDVIPVLQRRFLVEFEDASGRFEQGGGAVFL